MPQTKIHTYEEVMSQISDFLGGSGVKGFRGFEMLQNASFLMSFDDFLVVDSLAPEDHNDEKKLHIVKKFFDLAAYVQAPDHIPDYSDVKMRIFLYLLHKENDQVVKSVYLGSFGTIPSPEDPFFETIKEQKKQDASIDDEVQAVMVMNNSISRDKLVINSMFLDYVKQTCRHNEFVFLPSNNLN